MAIFGASFQIGRSALAAYQSAIAITGQNIANVGNPNYARQLGHLVATPGGMTLAGVTPGTGVGLDRLQRRMDEGVESRLRLALAEQNRAQITYQSLSRIETLYNELSQYDLSTQLGDFFGAFQTLQTDPADLTARDMVLANADAVVATMRRLRTGIVSEAATLNNEADSAVSALNAMLGEIAGLNRQIVSASSRGLGGDGALRDRRDALLRELSGLLDIQTREQPTGAVNVYVGSEPLVEYARARTVQTQRTLDGGLERLQVRFTDTGGLVPARQGKLAAITAARDTHLAGQLTQLDQLAQALIYEVNVVHSTGQGLRGYTNLTSGNAVADPAAALNASGLGFPVRNGSFLVQLRDRTSGQVMTRLVEVDLDGLGGDTSLNSLAQALSAIPGLQAQVTGDGRLAVAPGAAFEVTFAEDSSGALAALGLGGFFTGTDAATIGVSSAVRTDPRLIATSLTGAPGDGGNAGRLATLGTQMSDLLGASVQDFHARSVNQLAVVTAAAQTAYDAGDAVFSGLLAQREAVSGVNLDEEAINLSMFERAFQGASRYLSVLDTLADDVLSLVR